MRGGVAHALPRGVMLVLLAAITVGVSSCARPGASPTAGPPFSTVPLLPGEQLWHGVPSYLFGTNDTQSWNLSYNVDTMPQIQQEMKAAHLTLMRTFFFEHSLYDNHPTTDAELDQRLATIQNSGMVCLGELATKNSMAWDEHVVKYLGTVACCTNS